MGVVGSVVADVVVVVGGTVVGRVPLTHSTR